MNQNQAYLLAMAAGYAPLIPVRAAIGGFLLFQDLPFAGGVQLVQGDRVLIVGGLDRQRGIYIVGTGVWSRSTEDLANGFTFATDGTNAGGWALATPGVIVAGETPQTWVPFQPGVQSTSITGTVTVAQGTSPWIVDGSGVVQPISATALPLPNGASTSDLQTTGNTSLASILAAFAALATSALQTAGNTILSTISTAVAAIVTALASPLPLPTGASTAAAQATGNTALAAIQASVAGTLTVGLPSGASTSALQGTGNTSLAAIAASVAGTLAVSAASLPLPSGASTSANQATGNSSLSAIASSVAGTLLVDGSAHTQPVSATSLPLPTGAATAAAQTTGNTSLASIATSVAALWASLGQKTMAASAPVVIASDQSTLPVSAGSLPLPAGASTSALQTSGNTSLTAIASSVAGTLAVSAASLPLPAGASTAALQTSGNTSLTAIASSVAGTLVVDASGHTVPVSAASLPLPTGAATAAKQPALGTAGSASADVISVQGISGGVAQPISAAALPLPTGAGTSVNQTSILGRLWAALGQAVMASSAPVTIASDQTPLGDLAPAGFTFVATGNQVFATNGYTCGRMIVGNTAFSGTLILDGSQDGGATYLATPLPFRLLGANGNSTTALTANNTIEFLCGGYDHIRVRCSVFTSGVITCTLRLSVIPWGFTMLTGLPSSTATIGNVGGTGTQGTPAGGVITTQVADTVPASTAIAGNGNILVTNLAGAKSVGFYLAAGTTLVTLTPQYSADGQTSWSSAGCYFEDAANGTIVASLTTVSGQTGLYPIKVPPGAGAVRIVASGYVSGTSTGFMRATQFPSLLAKRATYAASFTGAVTATNPTDIFTITGAAGKSIRITALEISGDQTSALTISLRLLKYSTALTGGTPATVTAVPYRTANPASAATVQSWSTNPSGGGALVGAIRSRTCLIPGLASPVTAVYWDFGTRSEGEVPEVNSASEVLSINLGAAAAVLTGNSFNIWVEWTEV